MFNSLKTIFNFIGLGIGTFMVLLYPRYIDQLVNLFWEFFNYLIAQ